MRSWRAVVLALAVASLLARCGYSGAEEDCRRRSPSSPKDACVARDFEIKLGNIAESLELAMRSGPLQVHEAFDSACELARAQPEEVAREEGLIDSLAKTAQSQNCSACRTGALNLLLTVSHHERNLLKMGSHAALVDVLEGVAGSADSSGLATLAMELLQNLAAVRENRVKLFKHRGIVDAAIEGIRGGQTLAIKSLGLLANLGFAAENQVHLFRYPGVLPALVNALEDRDLCKHALAALQNIAFINQVEMWEFPGLVSGTLAALNYDDDAAERAWGLLLLMSKSAIPVSKMLRTKGLIKRALDTVESNNGDVGDRALDLLTNIAVHPDVLLAKNSRLLSCALRWSNLDGVRGARAKAILKAITSHLSKFPSDIVADLLNFEADELDAPGLFVLLGLANKQPHNARAIVNHTKLMQAFLSLPSRLKKDDDLTTWFALSFTLGPMLTSAQVEQVVAESLASLSWFRDISALCSALSILDLGKFSEEVAMKLLARETTASIPACAQLLEKIQVKSK